MGKNASLLIACNFDDLARANELQGLCTGWKMRFEI